MKHSFTNDLGADSLDTVELIMEFEKEFNISIPDEQAETITTVGQAVTYLEEHAKVSTDNNFTSITESAFGHSLNKREKRRIYYFNKRRLYMQLKRVVVTGLGVLTPDWQNT